jgi:predicted nucleic acid-binding protein
MAVLIDTNVLLALAFPKDTNHQTARTAMRDLTQDRVIAAPVLPELFFMMTDRLGYRAAVTFFTRLQTAAFQIEALTPNDMARMSQIMIEYEDNTFDYVDAAIMALSERLNITTIYTFDRRDFTTFRPAHCDYLELLP